MVKVINPFFSQEVRGRFKDVVYQTGPSGNKVITHTPQRKPPSQKQIEMNFKFGRASENWALLPEPVQHRYIKYSSGEQMSAYNYFVKLWMNDNLIYGLREYGYFKYS